ncbi:hypothetical protein EG329_012118 [Mollisiaceae sp. DMI_Dod_QoI]|nr:hypothetical protein EG329_012118 [Helotiales sp. DMI_Dod_QoI]
MPSIIRATLGALLLSAFSVAIPVADPNPQFASGTQCFPDEAGRYFCADNWNFITVCNGAIFEIVAQCNGRTCGYENGVPYCF